MLRTSGPGEPQSLKRAHSAGARKESKKSLKLRLALWGWFLTGWREFPFFSLVFFCFLRFASLISFFLVIPLILLGQGQTTAIYRKNGEFHSDPVCTDPVLNHPGFRLFSDFKAHSFRTRPEATGHAGQGGGPALRQSRSKLNRRDEFVQCYANMTPRWEHSQVCSDQHCAGQCKDKRIYKGYL